MANECLKLQQQAHSVFLQLGRMALALALALASADLGVLLMRLNNHGLQWDGLHPVVGQRFSGIPSHSLSPTRLLIPDKTESV